MHMRYVHDVHELFGVGRDLSALWQAAAHHTVDIGQREALGARASTVRLGERVERGEEGLKIEEKYQNVCIM